ncbi:MAG: HU family DNA-binding protein, partial [Prevotella sp.]|nr:HU family DNA-binding protein [Prevotella sp.]
ADHIQDNVSAKKSDVIAVLKELVVVMGEAFSAGYGVKLDGFGSFKVGLKTKAAESAKEFTTSKHIVGSRINFQPETHWSAADPKRQKQFLSGLKVEEYDQYAVDKSGDDGSPTPALP